MSMSKCSYIWEEIFSGFNLSGGLLNDRSKACRYVYIQLNEPFKAMSVKYLFYKKSYPP